MSTKDQILSSELHGEALLTVRRPELQPLIDHLRKVAQGRDDIRVECAGILAGSWFSSGARRGEDLIAAGLLMLAGPVDLDELDRWMRTGWERRRGGRYSVRAGILRNVTRGLDLVLGFDSTLIDPPMAHRHSYACIGRYAPQQPPRRTTLLWQRQSYASSLRAQRLWHATKHEDYEQRPESVPAIRGRSPRSRGVRVVGVVGAQLRCLE